MPTHPLSMGSNVMDQATMAAILGARGRNPLNEKEVLAIASSVRGAPCD